MKRMRGTAGTHINYIIFKNLFASARGAGGEDRFLSMQQLKRHSTRSSDTVSSIPDRIFPHMPSPPVRFFSTSNRPYPGRCSWDLGKVDFGRKQRKER